MINVDSNLSSPCNIISTSKSGNILQNDALEKTARLMELDSQKLGEHMEPDVAPKEVKSRGRAIFDMICLLLEGMTDRKVRNMVKLDFHQLNVKGKYSALA